MMRMVELVVAIGFAGVVGIAGVEAQRVGPGSMERSPFETAGDLRLAPCGPAFAVGPGPAEEVPLGLDRLDEEEGGLRRNAAYGAIIGGVLGGLGAWLLFETAEDPVGTAALVIGYGTASGAALGAGIGALLAWWE